MDNSLNALCDTIKKVVIRLKPQTNSLSFIIITGKNEQGKSALLKQSSLEEMPVLSEQHAKVYFNAKGIIVELGENWLINSKTLLQNTFKQLNKCSRYLKITGLVLCIDINTLLDNQASSFSEQKKSHLQLLARIGSNLTNPIELAIIFTKMDTLAGFSEFYQTDHVTELAKPFGFSLDCANILSKKIELYNEQFNHLVELQGQQVINKMHPARSTIKRSLIREFPLQLASLRMPIQSLLQGIPPRLFHIHSLFFTSAEQGGLSIDRLNKKIEHEYALVVQDTFVQAINFRSYFVEGALKTIQEQCSQKVQPHKLSQKPLISAAIGCAGISLILLSHHYFRTALLLDEASKELLRYDVLNTQGNSSALFHLSNATNSISRISTNSISLPTVHQLKAGLNKNISIRLIDEFIPSLTNELEQVITNPSNTPIVRYKALKIYLMMSQPEHFSSHQLHNWFKEHWHELPANVVAKQLALLTHTFNKAPPHVPVKEQIISDARNYLNALPTSYLYYSLAKESFTTKKEKISVEGFNLATNELPSYFTKAGFRRTLSDLSRIAHTLQGENWVLARQDLTQLPNMLIQAYCFDYVTWWQTFMRKSQPIHYQNYQQGRQVVNQLHQTHTLSQLITLIQQETKPDLDNASPFNQFIANKFTDLNLLSLSTINDLAVRITDLERFIATLSVIDDGGKTAFTITKSRFINEQGSDALSLLFTQAHQLPEPLSSWLNQLAADTWIVLIKDCRSYINQQWQQTVFREYKSNIANRYPLDAAEEQEIRIADFNHFFSTHGTFNTFTEQFIKPFLDVTNAQWKPKSVNGYIMPISSEALDEIIRANIITNMFFPNYNSESKIEFSLQKINLDPIVASLSLQIGTTILTDNQGSESFVRFIWPQNDAKLSLNSIEGNHYELAEQGSWAIFKLLEKVNVLIDEQDSSSLQILFEVNSNSGRYLLKTNNQVNPFTPGILNGFSINEAIV